MVGLEVKLISDDGHGDAGWSQVEIHIDLGSHASIEVKSVPTKILAKKQAVAAPTVFVPVPDF